MLKKTAEDWFAENMRSRREVLGISQAGLARALTEAGHEGIHQTTIARMEKGERVVRLSEAESIAEILDTHLTFLLEPRVSVLSRVEKELDLLGERHRQLRDLTVDYEVCRARLSVAIQQVQGLIDGDVDLDDDSREALFSAFSVEYLTSRLDAARKWENQTAPEVVENEMVFARDAAESARADQPLLGPLMFIDATGLVDDGE